MNNYFCHKIDSKNYSFEYNGYKALIKYIKQKLQIKHFSCSQKTLKFKNCLNFEKIAFWWLWVSSRLSIWLCLHLQLWFNTLKTVLPIIQHTPVPSIKCMTITEVNWYFVWLLTASSTHLPEGKETNIIST